MSKKAPVAGFDTRPENINREGRPKKGYSITEAFRSMFDTNPETKAVVVQKIYEQAQKGDSTAIKLLWNYMDGLPPQAIDVTSGGEKLGTEAEVIAAIESSKKK